MRLETQANEVLESPAPATAPARMAMGFSWIPVAVLILVATGLFALRLAAPPNLLDKDQERPVAYILDVVQNGHWICQRDLAGDITSKPPVWTWLSALLAEACGRVTLFTLYLPGAAGLLGAALLIFVTGRRRFGERASLYGALALKLTPAGLKAFGLARTDGVFLFTVTAAAFLALRAWQLGRGWIWFWLAAGVATLTKGPLGLLLAAGGLAAVFWEKKSGELLPVRGRQWPGVILCIGIAAGWFALAYAHYGEPLVSKMLIHELLGHAVSDGNDIFPGMHFYQPPFYFLGQSAPWSLFGIYGLWRLWKEPSRDANERRLERFLFCWFLLGLALFSIAPNQRPDHLWPILPPAALLAGRELDRLARKVAPSLANTLAFATVALAAAGYGAYYLRIRVDRLIIRQTVALKELANEINQRGGTQFPLTHVDDPMTLQAWLNTMRPHTGGSNLVQLLRCPEPFFLAVDDVPTVKSLCPPSARPLYTILPAKPDAHCPTRVLSNQRQLNPTDTFALCFGPILARAHHVQLLRVSEREFTVRPVGAASEMILANNSAKAKAAGVGIISAGKEIHRRRLLAPGESWQINLSEPLEISSISN